LSTLINQLGKIAVDGAFYDAITNAPTIPDVNHCPLQPENRKWNREKSTSEGLVNENDAEALRTMTDVDVDV